MIGQVAEVLREFAAEGEAAPQRQRVPEGWVPAALVGGGVPAWVWVVGVLGVLWLVGGGRRR